MSQCTQTPPAATTAVPACRPSVEQRIERHRKVVAKGRLDLRADRRWHRCWGDINLYFDVQNALNYDNVEGREFDFDANGDTDIPGLPIIPFIGVEFLPLL